MSSPIYPLLALDTAAGATACILMPDGQSFTASAQQPRAHSRELLPMLQSLLQQAALSWQEMAGFAVGVGPGSFTGLRVACATIAGINAALEKPVYDLCSLSITAQQTSYQGQFWVIEDARSQLVYAAKWQHGQLQQAATCLTWDSFSTLPASAYLSLTDIPIELPQWQALSTQVSREDALLAAVQGLDFTAQQSQKLWAEPIYLQASQAEKNLI
ncbi:MAG: tRNA (adenosine(37)-N6)-threonylcarbamoyltransferase complex dimerization subunit type 1 TsaB [Mariprofundaceae bacterium]|nr:tRNA (adenosine(37)-N6)-threonylcarbamoyltransferase complex dimerization subunit type 1 TsaB [Mariprofundaceae bacterium]